MAARWYVISFQPGREGVAELHLQRQGFHVWMPRYLRVVSHARRRYEKRVPFFPGYMFVSFDVERDRWRAINGTTGVRSLIMQGERPVPCPEGIVEKLQMLAGKEGLIDTSGELAVGDRVRVLSGPFADSIGSLVRVDGAGRVRILLQMMRAEIAVTLDAQELMLAEA